MTGRLFMVLKVFYLNNMSQSSQIRKSEKLLWLFLLCSSYIWPCKSQKLCREMFSSEFLILLVKFWFISFYQKRLHWSITYLAKRHRLVKGWQKLYTGAVFWLVSFFPFLHLTILCAIRGKKIEMGVIPSLDCEFKIKCAF